MCTKWVSFTSVYFCCFVHTLASSMVIPSIIRGGCYVLKMVTTSETWSAAVAVFLPFVLRGAGVHVQNRRWTMSVLLLISHSQWSVANDKIFHPTARCHLCWASLSTSQVAVHPATSADSCRQRSAWLYCPCRSSGRYTVERSSVHLNVIRRMSWWTHHGRYMYLCQTKTLSKFIPPRRLKVGRCQLDIVLHW